MNPFDIRGRIVIVTGGAGNLGHHYGNYLRESGARVVNFDLEAAFVKKVHTGEKWDWAVDVADAGAVEYAVDTVSKVWGVPYGLVNNAAIDFPPGTKVTPDQFERALHVNVTGALICAQQIGKRMAEAGRGSIVNIGSVYGQLSPDQRIYDEGFVKPISYSVTKSALHGMTRWLATYWQGLVRVNLLVLGGVYNEQPEAFQKKYSARVPMGRMAHWWEYLGPLHFLLSEASSYMTGSSVTVDGGLSAW